MSLRLIKKAETNNTWDSYAMRADDLVTAFRLFLKRPIIGYGFYNTSVFTEVSFYHGGNSNGLLTMMYTTGLLGVAFFVYPFIRNIIATSKKIDRRIEMTFFFFVIAINFTEPIYALPIMMFILAREYRFPFYHERKQI